MSETDILGLNLQVFDKATTPLMKVGSTLRSVMGIADQFTASFNKMESEMNKSTSKMSSGLKTWAADYKRQLNTAFDEPTFTGLPNENKALKRYEQFNHKIHQMSNKYNSIIMGSVALSMSGISAMNFGRPILDNLGKMITQAGDFQASMEKIQLATDNFNKSTGQSLDNANKMINKTVMAAGIASTLSNKEMAQMAYNISTQGYHDSKGLNSMIAPAMLLQGISDKKLDENSSPLLLSSLMNKLGIGVGNTINTTLARQNFTGVSSNALGLVNMITKTVHDAHLNFDEIYSYQNSAGPISSYMPNIDPATFFALGGALKKSGEAPRRAGSDVQGLIRSAGLMDSLIASGKPGVRGDMAKEFGARASTLSQGDFIANLLAVYDKASAKQGEQLAQANLTRVFGTNGMKVVMAVVNQRKLREQGKVEMNATELRNDIAGAGTGKYASERFDKLSQTFPMAWDQFKGTMQGIGQIIGGSILPPLTTFIIKMTDLGGKFMDFAEKHPTLIKVLGTGLGLTGLITMASGAFALFAGQLLSGFASIANFRLQLAYATGNIDMFKNKMMTVNEVLGIGGFNGMFKKALISLSLFGIAIAGGVVAWQNDFMGLKTAITGWYDSFKKQMGAASGLLDAFNKGNQEKFQTMKKSMDQDSRNQSKFADFLVKVGMVTKTVFSYMNMQKIPTEQWKMLKDEGLLPVVETFFNLKYSAETFFDGFEKGVKGIGDGLKIALLPLKLLFGMFGMGDIFTGGPGKSMGGLGETFGHIAKIVVPIGLGIMIWGRSIGFVIKQGINLWNTITKIRGGLKDISSNGLKGEVGGKIKAAILGGAKGVLLKALGEDSYKAAAIITKWVAKGVREGVRDGSAFLGVPHYMPPSNGGPAFVRGSGKPTRGRFNYRPGSQPGYEDWWVHATGGLNGHNIKELEYQAMYGRKRGAREAAQRALELHRQNNLSSSMDELRDIMHTGRGGGNSADLVRSGQYSPIPMAGEGVKKKGLFSRFRRGGKGGGLGIAAGQDFWNLLTANRGGRIGSALRATGRGLGAAGGFLGKGAGFLGKGAMGIGRLGMKALGPLGMAASLLTDIPGMTEEYKASGGGLNGVIGAAGSALGISKKGGVSGALGGAASGAMIGMMFGPIGAGIGAAIGAGIGAIGTDRIKQFGDYLKKKVPEWGEDIKNSFLTAVTAVGNFFTGLGQKIKDTIFSFMGHLKDQWGALEKDHPIIAGVAKTIFNLTPQGMAFNAGKQIANFFSPKKHAGGLGYVPYNGYPSILHEGERVLTASEAQAYRQGQPDGGGGGSPITFQPGAIQITMANASPAEVKKAAGDLFKEFMKMVENKNIANYRPARMRGPGG